MTGQTWQSQSITLTCLLSLALVSCSDRTLVQMQLGDRLQEGISSLIQQQIEFEPPPDGAPDDRKCQENW